MRGHIRQRGKDSWVIVYDIGRDATGARRQKWQRVPGTRKDAERELAKILHEMNTGAYVEPSKMTVGEYLDRWLEDYARPNVAAKTFERYHQIVRQHLSPALGHHPLSKLQPLHIQACYSKASASGRVDGRGGLSPQSVLHHHRVLRQALSRAVKWRLLVVNPADAAEPPSPQRKEMQALDDAETAKLLRAAQGTWLHVPVALAVTTGLRRGEVLGLRWDDLNLDAGTLAVRQSLQQTKDGLAFKQPKNGKSRVVALPGLTIEILRQHRARQATEKLALGGVYDDQRLVCAAPTGKPYPPDNISGAFARLVGRAGVKKIRFHDLRHTHATQLLGQGVHPKVVSERLGHATVAITLDIYSHVLPGMQEDAAAKVDQALRAAIAAGLDVVS